MSDFKFPKRRALKPQADKMLDYLVIAAHPDDAELGIGGTILALKPLGYEVVNLGSDRPVVLMEAIHLVEQAVGRKATLQHQPRHAVDLLETWADIGKARDTLGWRPETQLEQGVRNLVAWYKQNREWAKGLRTD